MSIKIVGFIGIDKYDIISYLAQLAGMYKKKVLVADYTSLQATMCTLPSEDYEEVLHYRSADYRSSPSAGEIERYIMEEEYDFIFMDLDFNIGKNVIKYCTQIYFVSDLQRHHLDLIASMHFKPMVTKGFVIKMGEKEVYANSYLEQIFEDTVLSSCDFHFLYWEEGDMCQQLRLQYQHMVPLRCFSQGYRKELKRMLMELMEVTEASAFRLFRQAERGNCQ